MKTRKIGMMLAIAASLSLAGAPSFAEPPHHKGHPPAQYHAPAKKHRDNSNSGAAAVGAIIGFAAGAMIAGAAKNTPQPQAPRWCNVRACDAQYKSFRASDCTYQPYHGPRKVCRY